MESAYKEVERLLDQIRSVTTNPAIIRASDQIEVLCRAQFVSVENFLPDIRLSRAERCIIGLLRSRLSHTVSKDALLDSYSYAKGNSPHPKIVDVYICKIRRKLKQAEADYHILTDHSLGYRMVPGRDLAPEGTWADKYLFGRVAA